MTPVKLEPKAWADLTLVSVVPHGQRVKKGDLLIGLDLDKLREQIDELEKDRPASALALATAEAELANLEQTTPLRLEAARRTHRVANEDLAYFEQTGRKQKETTAEFALKAAQQRLDNEREELKQLQKMYKADDLVEETEEIVLKRQKFAVEFAENGLEVAKQGTQLTLKTAIPREQETLQAAKRDQDLALTLATETVPRALEKKRLEVDKLKRDQRKADKRLADLKQDFESLTVRAPLDGLVYYGACESGKWTTGPVVAKKLLPGTKLIANEILLTVVNPDRLILKAVIQEADLAQFKSGQGGTASLVSASEKKFAVKLDGIGPVPLPTGGFEARLSVRENFSVHVVPGMNCKVTFEPPPQSP